FKDNVLSYWCYAKDATNELGLVACRIFNICVNAAFMPKALNMSKLHADITYQHHHEPDDLFSTFFNTASMYDNTTTQTMHNNAAITQTTHSNTTLTQITRNNTTLTQTIHNNTYIDLLDKTQNEQDNKDEDNKECYLPYISEAEFEMLDEEEEMDIIKDQDDYVELDDIIHLAIDENAKWKLSSLFCLLELL
ncbi:39280_t:CDS:2, partial [Gigaspora margarita]